MFNITQEIYSTILTYGDNSPEYEVCGALFGSISNQGTYTCTEFLPMTNVSPNDKGVHYIPDPNEFFKVIKTTKHFNIDNSKDLLGIFHTHPHNKPIASITDITGAGYKGVYMIYSPKYKSTNSYFWDGDEQTRNFKLLDNWKII